MVLSVGGDFSDENALPSDIHNSKHSYLSVNTKLYVGNLAFSATEQDVADLFAQHGTVDEVKIMIDRESNRSRGFAFVTMHSTDGLQKAIQFLDGAEFQGRALKVNEARPKEDKGFIGRDNHGAPRRERHDNRY